MVLNFAHEMAVEHDDYGDDEDDDNRYSLINFD